MLSVSEALAKVCGLMTPVGAEVVPLDRACGRVLMEEARARRDQPPFAASAMDGYAVKNAETRPGAAFRVVGAAPAGKPWDGEIRPGEALRIFTGAPMPQGADRVVIQEDVEREGDQIRLKPNLDPGANIRAAGSDFSTGEALIKAGRRLQPRDVALLAAMNIPSVAVRRRPVVAIMATGDELVWPGESTGAGQIVSSNNFGVAAVARLMGAEARLLPIARDSIESLQAAARGAMGADLLVTLGGASVGEHDLVREALGAMGLELALYKIAMRPGKPLAAGRLGALPVLGLPGNPVSAMVCAEIFMRPALEALLGRPAGPRRRTPVRLGEAMPANGEREHYMRARLEERDGALWAFPFASQDSARLGLLSQAEALLVRPPHAPAAKIGETAHALLLDEAPGA